MTAAPPPTLTYIGYDRFLADVEAIAVSVESDSWQPDFIVGIGRGGLVPGVFLSHRIGAAMLSVDHSAKVAGFSDDLLVQLAVMTVTGKRILFVDDINDTGATLVYLRDIIAASGGDARNQRFAVLVDNIRSDFVTDYRSRTIDRAIAKDWFVFPWEAVAPGATLIADALEVPARLA